MESGLKDKIAFFSSLKSLVASGEGDDDDDAIGVEEQRRRDKCRAFGGGALGDTSSHSAAAVRQAVTPSTPSTTVSELVIPMTAEADMVPYRRRVQASRMASSAEDADIIPETARPLRHQQASCSVNPPPALRRTRTSGSAGAEGTPSGCAEKEKKRQRKKAASSKLRPEAQQYLKGFRLYYIPNDDVNPVRRLRIVKAQEYGAVWVRDPAMATHVVVDKSLTYGDIKELVFSNPGFRGKMLVNEDYPLQCMACRAVVNPDQPKYHISGYPTQVAGPDTASLPPELPGTSQAKDNSLVLKESRKRRRVSDPLETQETPSSTQSMSLPEPPVLPFSQQHAPQPRAETEGEVQQVRQVGQDSVPLMALNRATSCADELSNCITVVREKFNDISLDDEEDEGKESKESKGPEDEEIDASSSDQERQRTKNMKRRKRRSSPPAKNKSSWQDKFQCMKGGSKSGDSDDESPNAQTIEKLQRMHNFYAMTDHWRCYSYRRAIGSLRQQRERIMTADQAIQLDYIGESIAAKIEEIVQTDRLRKLDHAEQDPHVRLLQSFVKIYGVGLAQAQRWIAQGFRTLDELRQKAALTTNQRLGLEHYDDLLARIPRAEVEALGRCVMRAATAIDPDVEMMIAGSYRRGAEHSGDIDLIITKKQTRSAQQLQPFLHHLLDRLERSGFITATLAGPRTDRAGGGSKWHGCCVLPAHEHPDGDRDGRDYRPVWRRIDLLLVPESELGAAVLYFTGDDMFNRSMRLLASKKGMRLNQRGLYRNVMTGPDRARTSVGELVEGRDERRIFDVLGVQWREPHERWCG